MINQTENINLPASPEEQEKRFRQDLFSWLKDDFKKEYQEVVKEGNLLEPDEDYNGYSYEAEIFMQEPGEYLNTANPDLLKAYGQWATVVGAPLLSEMEKDNDSLNMTLRSFIRRKFTLIEREYQNREIATFEKNIKLGVTDNFNSGQLDLLMDKYFNHLPDSLYQNIKPELVHRLDGMEKVFNVFQENHGNIDKTMINEIKKSYGKFIECLKLHHHEPEYIKQKTEELKSYTF